MKNFWQSKLTGEDYSKLKSNLKFSNELSSIKNVDLVIEAINEDEEKNDHFFFT